MSNYHYNDQSGCPGGCLQQSSYSDLKDTTNFSCDQPCLCRFGVDERSSKDRMYYNWFVLDQPMQLPPPGKPLPQPKNDICKKQK
jgi:hypothetical protein